VRRSINARVAHLAHTKGLTFVEAPRSLRVAHRAAAFTRIRFPVLGHGVRFDVEARALAIAAPTAVVAFGFSGAASGDERCEAEFKSVLRSIKPLGHNRAGTRRP
jgi:hypothetical protein